VKDHTVDEVCEEIECISSDLGIEIADLEESNTSVACKAASILQDAREALDALVERQGLN
jgi:hypothetical protein